MIPLYLHIILLFSKILHCGSASNHHNWKYTIYFEDNCSGYSETFVSSVPKLPYTELIKSISIYGSWVEYPATEYRTNYDFPDQKPIIQESYSSPICITSNSYATKSIRKMESTGISFFRERSLAAGELFFSGLSLSLPTRQLFSSFAYAGNQSWNIFDGINLSGKNRCLSPSNHTVVYRLNEPLELGSVHVACGAGSKDISESPGITFYTWDNRQELFFRGTELRLPYALKFQSYSLHGKNQRNWTIWCKNSVDASITEICLASVGIEENVINREPYEFSIIGIKLGCYHNETTVVPVQEANSQSSSGKSNLVKNLSLILIFYVHIFMHLIG